MYYNQVPEGLGRRISAFRTQHLTRYQDAHNAVLFFFGRPFLTAAAKRGIWDFVVGPKPPSPFLCLKLSHSKYDEVELGEQLLDAKDIGDLGRALVKIGDIGGRAPEPRFVLTHVFLEGGPIHEVFIVWWAPF